MEPRLWVYNERGELQRTITYKFPKIPGSINRVYILDEINVINGKPVSGTKLIDPHLIENKTYLGKPEYEGVLINT